MWTVVFGLLVAILGTASAGEVCCEDLNECFTDDKPFNRMPLPSCPGDLEEKFIFYDRSSPAAGTYFLRNEVPSSFSTSRRTLVMTHGWLGDGSLDWLIQIKDLMLQKDDFNIIVIDWNDDADYYWYPKAASNTRTIGAEVAHVVNNIVAQTGVSFKDFWCIGFSLGAHVCGHMGMRTKQKFGRVTGLDPAGPFFQNEDLTQGLNPTSADFVDVIHTDGEGLIYYCGKLAPIGHMDFYPNEGKDQPGCWTYMSAEAQFLKKIVPYDDSWRMGCSHYRAVWYFMETVRDDASCHVSRSKCTDHENLPGSCEAFGSIRMGYYAEENIIPGIYYLETNKSFPYCKN